MPSSILARSGSAMESSTALRIFSTFGFARPFDVNPCLYPMSKPTTSVFSILTSGASLTKEGNCSMGMSVVRFSLIDRDGSQHHQKRNQDQRPTDPSSTYGELTEAGTRQTLRRRASDSGSW